MSAFLYFRTPLTPALNEIAVIGYGQQKKADLTFSIAVVGSEDMARTPAVLI